MAELENRLMNLEHRVSKLERNNGLEIPQPRRLDELASKLQGKVEKIQIQGLIILALYYKPKQLKSDLLDLLLRWGVKKTVHGWFKGSNFKVRLLDTGIIMQDGTNSNDDELYSLTITKGIPKAKELIEKYALN